MKRVIALLLALASLGACAGCKSGQAQAQTRYALYFTVGGDERHGPAIRSQPWEEAPEDCTPEDLVKALLSGPTQEELSSPFPRGVALSGWQWEGDTVVITLSEQYSGLADVSLTLADYCIVLTLCQLEGVEAVEIVSPGYSGNYRSHQVLRPDEAELAMADGSGT